LSPQVRSIVLQSLNARDTLDHRLICSATAPAAAAVSSCQQRPAAAAAAMHDHRNPLASMASMGSVASLDSRNRNPLIRSTSSMNVNSGNTWLPATVAGTVALLVLGVILIVYARLTAPNVQPLSGTQENPPLASVPSPSGPGASNVPGAVGQSATGSFTPFGGPSALDPNAGTYNCLCVFDVDRTLTGKQGTTTTCFGNQEEIGTHDTAYAGGTMVLSSLSQSLQSTFCGSCYRAIVTAGVASGQGSSERFAILNVLGGYPATLSHTWSAAMPVTSSLVVGAMDGRKQETVRDVVNWFRTQRGINLLDNRVHFFDDRKDNILPFAGTGFNAKQVSCASRDNIIGLCGATPDEVVAFTGVYPCT